MTVKVPNKVWLKKCLKAGMKRSTCARIAKIRRQKGFGRAPRYGDAPEKHLDYAGNLTRMSNSYLESAEQSFKADDCTRAFKEGTRAQSAARAAMDHADAAGAAGKPPRSRASANAYAAFRDADDFMFGTFMRRCVRKNRDNS